MATSLEEGFNALKRQIVTDLLIYWSYLNILHDFTPVMLLFNYACLGPVKDFKLNEEESDCWAFVPGCNLLDRPIRHIKIMSVLNITSAQFSLRDFANYDRLYLDIKIYKMINCFSKMPIFHSRSKVQRFPEGERECIPIEGGGNLSACKSRRASSLYY